MIENGRIAKQISDLMLEFGARLNESVLLVKNGCSEEELDVYRSAIGEIMGNMLTEIMNPLYKRHPTLKPKELR
ncbi:MAG TPA: hypothetical protein VHY36_07905 [Steroidobacteraceae bacterium]|jgi:hypothetical protein|nr:hypothetical protein [Steroidobacteraceae bacterium]